MKLPRFAVDDADGDAQEGQHPYSCTIDSHKELGMKGELKVR